MFLSINILNSSSRGLDLTVESSIFKLVFIMWTTTGVLIGVFPLQ